MKKVVIATLESSKYVVFVSGPNVDAVTLGIGTFIAERLAHGEIGQGMNDYDAIFSTLNSAGFDGWISIEDGVDGPEQLERSVAFLRRKMTEHFP